MSRRFLIIDLLRNLHLKRRATRIAASSLFDADWYLNRYPDVREAKIDPALHYVVAGAHENRWPSPLFDPDWFARHAGSRGCPKIPLERYLALPVARRPSTHPLIDPDWYRQRHSDRLSWDQDVLAEFADNQQFRIEYSETNRGYTRTVNHGLELAGDHDVVLLNSDTVVGPGWLTRLAVAAWREDRIGAVTAVSNNAGAFSVPVTNEANSLPKSVTFEEYARAVAQAAPPVYPETPTGNGFCMYIRSKCIDETGSFDKNAFPRGYGEENDFCMRAGALGWKHIIDDSTLVAHERSVSFGKERNSLIAQGLAEINARYPDYGERVRQFLESDALREVCERVREVNDRLVSDGLTVRPRVLFVIAALHEAGGTSQTNRDLMSALDGCVEPFLLRSDGRLIELYDCRGAEQVLLDYRVLREPIRAFPHRSAEYDAIVAQWMFGHAIELVHVRHIALHGLGLIDVAHDLMLPVIVSFHDYYTVCPTVKLLDERLVFCGGKCTPTSGHCIPELWRDDEMPELKHAAVQDWQKTFGDALAKCNSLVTTSEAARRIILDNFPELKRKPFPLIPHGRDFPCFGSCAAEIDPSSTIRILVPGNITPAKGAGIITGLASRAADLRIEIYVLGSVLAGERAASIVEHGPYDREEFVDLVEEIQPHLGAVLSIWPETWCHTLTELWAAGVPVVGCDFGAVAERIRAHGGGWLLPAATSDGFATLLARLRQDPDEHTACVAEVRGWQQGDGKRQSCAAMAEHYVVLYSRLAAGIADESPGQSG